MIAFDQLVLSKDIDALIACRIPIKIDETSQTAEAAVPIVLKLEGPESIIYNQIGLKTFFSNLEPVPS